VFRAKNNVVPQQIYIFRDGVSEGEFLNVVDAECRALGGKHFICQRPLAFFSYFWSAVIKSTYPDKHQPKLLYIVVGKRHHVRFFPSHGQSAADPRGNGNFPSGLVVDEGRLNSILIVINNH
jgi:eukaryotic translation initiation factor 2C